jgi:hypothetical protein
MTCAEGKQTKNHQSKKESGQHSPIDRGGGVICSDLKGPITPVDRERNRYLVNLSTTDKLLPHLFDQDQGRSSKERSSCILVILRDVLIAGFKFCVQMAVEICQS